MHSTVARQSLQVAKGVTAAGLAACSKHHVVYEDGEEGLVDLATAQFRFLPPATSGPAAAAEAPVPASAADAPVAEAAAAVAQLEFTSPADVGEELHVWWRNDRVWYEGVVTHVLRNG